MEIMNVNELREKHRKERIAKAKIEAKKRKELIQDIQLIGGTLLGIFSMWLICSVFFTL